jgi:hypothetical protein
MIFVSVRYIHYFMTPKSSIAFSSKKIQFKDKTEIQEYSIKTVKWTQSSEAFRFNYERTTMDIYSHIMYFILLLYSKHNRSEMVAVLGPYEALPYYIHIYIVVF